MVILSALLFCYCPAHTPSSTFYRTGSTEYGKLAMFAPIKSSTQCGCDCFRCSLNSGKKRLVRKTEMKIILKKHWEKKNHKKKLPQKTQLFFVPSECNTLPYYPAIELPEEIVFFLAPLFINPHKHLCSKASFLSRHLCRML